MLLAQEEGQPEAVKLQFRDDVSEELHHLYRQNDWPSRVSYHWSDQYLANEDNLENTVGDYGVELYLNVPIPIFDYKKMPDGNWFKQFRLYLNYFGNVRTANSYSSPIYTPTNSFGIGLDIPVWVKYHGYSKSDRKSLMSYSQVSKIRSTHTVTLNLLAQHYSNGQSEEHINPASGTNNYLSGNFSTNFIRMGFTYGNIRKTKYREVASILGLNYQYDGGADEGFLVWDPGQSSRYGRHRLIANGKFSFLFLKTKEFGRSKKTHPIILDIYGRWTWIADQKEDLMAPEGNIAFDSYRHSMELITVMRFERHPAIGFIPFHFYRGRDYLNILYDVPISTITSGIYLNLNQLGL